MKGLWRCGVSLCGCSVKGTWREGFLAGDPEGYVEKALETGISFHRGPVLGNLEEGLSSGDFERRMRRAEGMDLPHRVHYPGTLRDCCKGTLAMGHLSLWELC